jgi:hypothetical protein
VAASFDAEPLSQRFLRGRTSFTQGDAVSRSILPGRFVCRFARPFISVFSLSSVICNAIGHVPVRRVCLATRKTWRTQSSPGFAAVFCTSQRRGGDWVVQVLARRAIRALGADQVMLNLQI